VVIIITRTSVPLQGLHQKTYALSAKGKNMRRAKGEGALIKRKGCRYWYASYYDSAGRQQRVSTKSEVKQEALGTLRRLMGDRDRGLAPLNAKLSYGDLRAGLLANYVERGNKSLRITASGDETIIGLRQLDEYCGYVAPENDKPGNPGWPVGRLTTDMAREFSRTRTAAGAGPAMANRSLQCLRRMLNIAHEDGKIQNVPKIRLLKEPPARKGFLEKEKFDEVVGALPGYLRPLITFLYYCGVRLGEALQIEWTQVDLERRLIVLHEEQTKNNEPRVIPLPSLVVAMLCVVEPKVGPVFDGTNLRTEWARACTAVGLGKMEEKTSKAGWKWQKYNGLIVHDLRRSAVRNLRLNGVPENVAMKISGHKTRAVFDRYNIVSTEDVSAAMRAVELGVGAKLVQNATRKPRKVQKLKLIA
jgi:integrase